MVGSLWLAVFPVLTLTIGHQAIYISNLSIALG